MKENVSYSKERPNTVSTADHIEEFYAQLAAKAYVMCTLSLRLQRKPCTDQLCKSYTTFAKLASEKEKPFTKLECALP